MLLQNLKYEKQLQVGFLAITKRAKKRKPLVPQTLECHTLFWALLQVQAVGLDRKIWKSSFSFLHCVYETEDYMMFFHLDVLSFIPRMANLCQSQLSWFLLSLCRSQNVINHNFLINLVITHNHNNDYQSPPSNADNVLRLEVQVDDTKGVEVGDTLTNLKIGTQGFLVEIGTLVFFWL